MKAGDIYKFSFNHKETKIYCYDSIVFAELDHNRHYLDSSFDGKIFTILETKIDMFDKTLLITKILLNNKIYVVSFNRNFPPEQNQIEEVI